MTLQFVYAIDPERSCECRLPVIQLTVGGKPIAIDGGRLSTLGGLLARLLASELEVRKREGKSERIEGAKSIASFRVAPAAAYELFQEMVASRGLYVRGKELVADFFSRLALTHVVRIEDDHADIEAFLDGATTLWDVASCDLILNTRPVMVVHEGFLYCVNEAASFATLSQAQQQRSRRFTLNEYRVWKDKLEEGDRLHIVGQPEEKALAKQTPLPVLQLKDRTGSFADLLMDYGEGRPVPFDRSGGAGLEWERDLLETGFQMKVMDTSSYYIPTDRAVAAIQLLLEVGWRVIDREGRGVAPLRDISIHLAPHGRALVASGTVSFANGSCALAALAGALSKNERFLALSPTTVGLIAPTGAPGVADLLQAAILVEGKVTLKRQDLMAVTLDERVHVTYDDPSLAALQGGAAPSRLLPAAFCGSLRPYQQEAVNWLAHRYTQGLGALLADDMGLGKTVQVIAFLATLEPHCRVLIVVPTSLLFHWKQEIEAFFPTLPTAIYHGTDRDEISLAGSRYRCYITSYGVARRDYTFFSNLELSCLIVDEAQAIKNQKTQLSQALQSIPASFRLSISGTPIENAASEIVAQFAFLQPDLLRLPQDLLSTTRLHQKVRPFMLRRKKAEVAQDLPERIDQTVLVEMDPNSRTIYERFLSGLKEGLLRKVARDGAAHHRMEILEAILRLRQICCHPALIREIVDGLGGCPNTHPAKFELLFSDLETCIAEGKKAIVFSQFSTMLALMGKEADARGIPFLLLDGATTKRAEIVRTFQEDERVPLFFISLKAGGVGLNLTRADWAMLYDPWWNAASENQAINRAHRIGRKETVFSKRYLVRDSIEEKIATLQRHKQELASSILDGDASSDGDLPQRLSIDDVADCLADV